MDRYDIPDGETSADCPYCGRPFVEEQLRDLHLGVDHPERLDDEQRDAYEAAAESEDDALRRHTIAAIGLLVVLYFGLLIVFALV
jgi:hypothetical protein